jgi:hypothetical protein
VLPAAPRTFLAQVVNICVHIAKDRSHPAGRSVTGLAHVIGVGADGRWRLESIT